MKNRSQTVRLRLITTALLALLPGAIPAHADSITEAGRIEYLKSAAFFASPDGAEHRKYAPDRDAKVLHLLLDFTPDFKKRTFEAKEVFNFKPNGKPLQELTLDAVDLTIGSVTATEKVQAWHATAEQLVITFAAEIPVDKEVTVTIAYHAEPTKGIYFRTPEMGYKEGDTHLFSDGEPIESRHWYPCFDSPNAKYPTELICRVPEGMTAVSNGRLVDEKNDAATGLVAFHWSQEKPHANYLFSLAAGYFKRLEDKHNDVPLAFMTPPSEFNEAANSFRHTKDIMAFFESEIGVPFPWAKYYQICLNDFMWGGMENTSATLLTDGTLFTTATENINDSDSLVAHEMAHQWFGDLVTCKDWSDIWLNEGFATYYAQLYDEHQNGRDAMLYDLYGTARGLTGMQNDTTAVVRHTYGDPAEVFGQFSYLSYSKGGWVLHMLRSQLGKDLYRRCIQTYIERHKFGNVVTEDLRQVVEELSGRSYDQFFDQWLYHAHNPELEASYSWDERTKLAKVSLRQTQKAGDNVVLFEFPYTIRFQGKFGTVDKLVQVKERDSEFSFTLESAPDVVRLDPNLTILAKTTFNVPVPMLYAQLTNQQDMVGRLLAIEQLSGKRDKETVAKLKSVLNHDSFYGVRNEAARTLRSMHTDEAFAALLASTNQTDARVRQQVVGAIASGFYRDGAYAFTRGTLETEKNPAILDRAIGALGDYAKPEVRETLVKFLNSDSYHNQLAGAAINAIRSQDDPAYIAPLLSALQKREAEFRSSGFSSGLGTLAYLARNEEKKDAIREFLLAQLGDKRKAVQTAAIRALGTLGDSKAIAALQTFASASKDLPEQGAAERAIAELRASRKPVDDFKNLRQEVLDLEKSSRELRKELDELKKQAAAAKEAMAGKPDGKPSTKPKPPLKSPKDN